MSQSSSGSTESDKLLIREVIPEWNKTGKNYNGGKRCN